MLTISKSSVVRLSRPALAMAFSTTDDINRESRIEKPNPDRIPVKKPLPRTGPRAPFWPWLKAYLKHTLHAIKLSYSDAKYYFAYKQNPNLSLAEHMKMRNIGSNLAKLVPFSFFIVVPLAELLIPVYLVFYQKAIPTRFLTQRGMDKTHYRISVEMKKAQEKIKKLLPAKVKKLEGLSEEDARSVEILMNWLANGFDYSAGPETLSRASLAFEKHVSKVIMNDGILVREYMFAIGLMQVTGLYYINNLFAFVGLGPITLASPILRTLFKPFPRWRIQKHLERVEAMDENITKEGVKELGGNQTVELAIERGMVPLDKKEGKLKQQLTEWQKLKELKLSTSFLMFLNVCGEPVSTQ